MKSVTLNEEEINRFINLTKKYNHESPHKYEKIRIKDGKIVFILYNSRKLVYNDNEECFDLLNKIIEKKEYFDNMYNSNNPDNHLNILDDFEYTIGSDETGKGEWYGPLVITAVCTTREENIRLKKIGVKDSKKLSKKQINTLYHDIEKLNIAYECIVLKPFSYNELYAKFKREEKNLNHLLAYLHYKAISTLLKELNTDNVLIIIDKFDYNKMNEYSDFNENIKVIQESDGERYIPVATSSIIAKYHYEKTLKEIEQRYNINLRKTKPKNINKDILYKVGKAHFKNVNKYL